MSRMQTSYIPMSGMDEWALFGFLDDEFGGPKNFRIKVSLGLCGKLGPPPAHLPWTRLTALFRPQQNEDRYEIKAPRALDPKVVAKRCML